MTEEKEELTECERCGCEFPERNAAGIHGCSKYDCLCPSCVEEHSEEHGCDGDWE